MPPLPLRSKAVAAVMIQLLSLPMAGCADARPAVVGSFIEDFDGPADALPSPQNWSVDIGSSAVHGWERGSLQTYTDSPDNVRLDGRGDLVITARNDGNHFTSGRISTRGKVEFGYGTIVARIKFPTGQGIWPAFWMLGSNIDEVGWPQCGEIDVMELINGATTYNVALHYPWGVSEGKGPIADLSADFHDYWMSRTQNTITVGVDDEVLRSFTPTELPPDSSWVFTGPMFVLLNVAVGGAWPGPPDESTVFPATMIVDSLRFVPLN